MLHTTTRRASPVRCSPSTRRRAPASRDRQPARQRDPPHARAGGRGVARAWATRCESRLATTAPARSSIARRCSSSSTACPAPKAEAPGSASRSFARACRRTAAGFGLHFGELSLRPVVVAEIHYVHTASSLQGEPGFGLRRARLGFNFAYGRTLAARVVFHAETERPGVLDAFVAWRPHRSPAHDAGRGGELGRVERARVRAPRSRDRGRSAPARR
jgi:hypothetical protein